MNNRFYLRNYMMPRYTGREKHRDLTLFHYCVVKTERSNETLCSETGQDVQMKHERKENYLLRGSGHLLQHILFL